MRRLLTVAAALGAAPSVYLLTLLAAAATGRRRSPADPGAPLPRFAVVVPAHDEEAGISRAVASLGAMGYEGGFETIVVADNCTDATADRARAAGATVWERKDPDRPGKGQALAWAFERVLRERSGTRAVAVVDADCTATPDLLAALGRRLAAGARAVQASYVVSNPDEAPAAAARFAGFALINHVRPLGKSVLGVSCGLLGSGMAFDADLLRELPWTAFEVTEDAEYNLRLAAAGVRVEFAPEAGVASPMPTSLDAAAVQRERWAAGTMQLARGTALRMIGAGLAARDANRVHAGVELLMPPQSLLLAGNGALLAAATAVRARRAGALAAGALGGQVGFVLGGLVLVRAPASAYRALALAPLLVARNASLYSRLLRGKRPAGWVRTPREPR
jgi:1,2-diacylglycerol 3-beta-glucosyltransferase